MPAIRHEAVVEVLRSEPQLLAMLLGRLGVVLPSGALPAVTDTNLSSRDPDFLKTLIADNVFLFQGIDKRVAVVFEVQTRRPDHSRELAWPSYLTSARAIHDCDTYLCVIGLSADAVRGSLRLIQTGHPGFNLAPRVTGHGLLPPPGGIAYGAGLAVIKVMTRELDLTTHEGRMFALLSITTAPDQLRERYTRYIRAVAPRPVREELTRLMTRVIKDPFMDGLLAQGEAKGKAIGQAIGEAAGEARILLRYLDTRFKVPNERRGEVIGCTDTRQLETWFDRALAARTLDEVFAS